MKSWSIVDSTPFGLKSEKGQVVSITRNSPRVTDSRGRKRLVPQENPLDYYRYSSEYGILALQYIGTTPNQPSYTYTARWFLDNMQLLQNYYNATPILEDLRNQAGTEFRLKCINTAANLAEMFATRREAANMITSAANRMASAYISLKKRDWRTCCNTLGIALRKPRKGWNPPSQWLEYVYGWKPLVQDIYGVCTSMFPDPVRKVKVVRKRKGNDRFRQVKSGNKLTYGEVSRSADVTVRVKGVVRVFSGFHRFGATNPALLAWELLPYSFVLDWLLPVGPWLEAACTPIGFKVENAVTASRVVLKNSGYGVYNDPGYYAGGANWTQENNRYFRVLTLPNVEYPHFKNPISLTHMANALALLAEAFDRR